MESYDIVVIGGGPGGYVAALRAADLGQKVALIEREHLGGVCLNWGCIPTKALLESAEILHKIGCAQTYGINVGSCVPDIRQVVKRSRDIVKQLTQGIKSLLNRRKVVVIEGRASICPGKVIEIFGNQGQSTKIFAKNIIIATGARPRIIPGFEPDGVHIWTAREAMTPDHVPTSLTIIGSGAIGMEFASFYNAFGTKVTVLEAKNSILPMEDETISALAFKVFSMQGIKIYTNVNLLSQQRTQDGVEVTFQVSNSDEKYNIKSQHVLMAVGVVGNTENIGLQATKIRVENGYIVTNKLTETDEPGVFAIGDVTAPPWLAHKASHEGTLAAEVAAGRMPHYYINKYNIPSCTYSAPQIASIGMTQAAAIAAGYQIKVGQFPFIGNGKALIIGDTNGLIKTIFDANTGELLGAHMIGHGVTELVQGYSITKSLEGTELDLMHTIFPHPTLSEMMHESVLQAYNLAIHI